jgi:hypothetical protein
VYDGPLMDCGSGTVWWAGRSFDGTFGSLVRLDLDEALFIYI